MFIEFFYIILLFSAVSINFNIQYILSLEDATYAYVVYSNDSFKVELWHA